jgi:H/ACA ribonucleoprotein complex subunit 3
MKTLILKCTSCGSYTLSVKCLKCGSGTIPVHPARFSPDDKYARYRSPLAYEVEF